MKFRLLLTWILVILSICVVTWNVYPPNIDSVSYSQFMNKISDNTIKKVVLYSDDRIEGYSTDHIFSSHVPKQASMTIIDKLEHMGADIQVASDDYYNPFVIISVIALIGLIYILYRNSSSSASPRISAIGFSKFNTKPASKMDIKFTDIAGIDEITDDLKEIVDFLKNPSKYNKLGSKIPKGILLIGNPGTGKTLLAKALSSEAEVPFFSVSGSEFIEMFAGVGASRVRDLFAKAKENSPCIIFIDEIDAIGKRRGVHFGGHDEREQTLNQILVEMDGFDSHKKTIIILGATNRADILDKALLRPGRFDRKVFVDMPDAKGREKILNIHVRNIPLNTDVDINVIARSTPGFSGADLANLANEASILAARANKTRVSQEDFDNAKDKIIMGSKRQLTITSQCKKITAYHEAGHALVSLFCDNADPIHKITIVPRSNALGAVVQIPEYEHVMVTKQKMHDNISIAVAGRVSEERFFGPENITSGASSDITYATKIAFAMVTKYGMSHAIGMVDSDLYDINGEKYLISPEAQNNIAKEVKLIIDRGIQCAKDIIAKYEKLLINIAETLLDKETITGDEVRKMKDDFIVTNQIQ